MFKVIQRRFRAEDRHSSGRIVETLDALPEFFGVIKWWKEVYTE